MYILTVKDPLTLNLWQCCVTTTYVYTHVHVQSTYMHMKGIWKYLTHACVANVYQLSHSLPPLSKRPGDERKRERERERERERDPSISILATDVLKIILDHSV